MFDAGNRRKSVRCLCRIHFAGKDGDALQPGIQSNARFNDAGRFNAEGTVDMAGISVRQRGAQQGDYQQNGEHG